MPQFYRIGNAIVKQDHKCTIKSEIRPRRRRIVFPLNVERAGILASQVGDDRRLGHHDVGGDLVGRRRRLTLVLPSESLQPKLVGRVGIWRERGEKKKAMKIKESEFNEKLTGRSVGPTPPAPGPCLTASWSCQNGHKSKK